MTRDWIGTTRGAEGLTKVTFLWEPTAAVPGVRRDEPRRVSLMVTNSAGDIVYRGKVPNDLAAPGSGASVSFDSKPGKLDFRITIEGDGTGTLDNENRELTVPDLNVPEVMVTTPRVWFGRTAREFQSLLADVNAKPTATREFRRTDRLLIRFDAMAPGDVAGHGERANAQSAGREDGGHPDAGARGRPRILTRSTFRSRTSRRGSICWRSQRAQKVTSLSVELVALDRVLIGSRKLILQQN